MNAFLNKLNEFSIPSKYTNWHNTIIHRAINRKLKSDQSYEEHHIFPVSFNEDWKNEKENLVRLTIREHYVIHLLLTKMLIDDYKIKMIRALFLLSGRCNSYNSRLFYSARLKFASYMKENNPLFLEKNKDKIRKALSGRSADTHEYIRKANEKKRKYNSKNSEWVRRSRKRFANTISAMSDEERKIKFGRTCSIEQREKFSVERKGQTKQTCERVKRMSDTILEKNSKLSPEEIKEKYTTTLGMKWHHSDNLRKSRLMFPATADPNEWTLGRKHYEN